MTIATRASEGQIAFAVQTAEGTPTATPKYSHPIVSGFPKPVEDIQEWEHTVTDDLIPGLYKTQQWWTMDTTFVSLPKSIATWARAALGAAADSGASDYTHTITQSATPPFITVYATVPGTKYRKFYDGTISEFSLIFEAGKPLMVNVKAAGYVPADLASVYTTATNVETIGNSGPWHTFIGSTLLRDLDATPGATGVADIVSGVITFTRELELIQTTALNPSISSYGRFRVSGSLDTIWNTTDVYKAFKATYYGSTTGTASSATVVMGALDFLFPTGPATDSTKTLQVQVPNVSLRCPDPPDADPSGGPLHVNLTLLSAKPSSGSIATIVSKNQVATA